MMSQSQVTEYFHGRKRNSNFQPSKRQKIVEAESFNSDVPNSVTLQLTRASGTKKTSLGNVQTKSTSVSVSSKKRSTRSGIPKLQKDNKSRNVRLNDIWPKACDTTLNSDLITNADHESTKVPTNPSVDSSSPVKQRVNVLEKRKSSLAAKHKDISVTGADIANTVSDVKLSKSPSKRTLQYNEAEERDRSIVSDVVTAVIDDHGNSHPCTPSKQRTMEPGVICDGKNNKRGRCIVPTNSNNYYKTPQKFDFSPFQSNTFSHRSSSARKKLVLSNVSVSAKSPPVFVFKGSDEKSQESLVTGEINEKNVAEVQNSRKDVTVELSDKVVDDKSSSTSATAVEPVAEPATPKMQNKELKTPTKNASNVVQIGTCRNLEQLKKKLQDLSPRKAGGSDTAVGGLSPVKSRSAAVRTTVKQSSEPDDSGLSLVSICTPSRPKPLSRLRPTLHPPGDGTLSTKVADSKLALTSFCTPSRAKSSLSARSDCIPHPHSTSLALPHSYYVLAELFQSADTIVSWLTNRAEICTFEKLKSAVQDMTKRAFSQRHLGQIHTVYPTAYRFKQEKALPMFGGKTSGYHLTIEAILDATSDDDDSGNVKNSAKKFTAAKLLRRKDIFYKNLLTIVKSYHREFLNKLNMCSNIRDDQIQQWHPKFSLDDVADIEPALLPQPPVVKKFMTAKDVLDEVKDKQVNPKIRKALEFVANKTPPTPNVKSPPTPSAKTPQKHASPKQEANKVKVACSPKGLPQSLLERIRAKEAQKIEVEMTRNPEDVKRRAMLERLSELTRIVRAHFLSQKRPALPLADIVKSFKDSYKTALGTGEAESHLRLIAEVVPDFLSIIRLKSGEYVKIDQQADLSSVHDVIQNIIKAI